MRGIEKANPETLYGIFGDAQWTNKDRLPDSLLRDLIEHFSAINLGNQAAAGGRPRPVLRIPHQKIRRCHEQEGRRILHAAPRGAVDGQILDPQEGESIYDPACGTGGMLMEAIHHVKRTTVTTARSGANCSGRKKT